MGTAVRWEFAVLGPVEVRRNGEPVPIPGRKARALLALLLLRANEVVARERLIDGLWGEALPESAANALQVHVHTLRKVLEDSRIATEGTGYRLRVEPDELDLHRFELLVEAGRHRDALELWRGEPLAGLEREPFGRREAERLEERRLETLEARIADDLAAGRTSGLVGELEALVDENPYRESLHALLMRALHAAGRQADALDAYTRTRRLLRDELGLEPGPELRELQARILRGEPAPAAVQPSELPTPATTLVGRELERAAVAAILRSNEVRLLTLTGPGGTGKTRLALAAARVLEEEGLAAAFVDLAPLAEAEQVLPAVRAALGLADDPSQSPLDVLATALRERDLVLVVDNFEHVLDAAPALAELLSRTTKLQLLVTSRAPLHLGAEHEYRVPPLAQEESMRLFVERGRAVGADLGVGDPLLEEICTALDHLPLALELAAARLRLFSPAALRDRLDQRLELLTGGSRDSPERQRTLRATIDWSYALLAPGEQEAFARLAAFAGSFAVVDAEAVTGASLDELAALVDAGLVLRTPDDRLRLLETVRQYAAEQARGDPLAHARHYLAVAQRYAPSLRGSGAEAALAALELEYDNLRAALTTARDEDDVDTLLGLTRALDRFWYVRGFLTEGLGWIHEALRRSESLRTLPRALVLKSASLLTWRTGDLEDAERYARLAQGLLEELGDEGELVGVFSVLGAIAHSRGDTDAAAPIYEHAVELAQRSGRRFERALVLNNLGGIAFADGDPKRAEQLYQEAVAEARSIDAPELVAFGLLGLMSVANVLGDPAGSLAYGRDCLDHFARIGFRDRMATCCLYLADVTADAAVAARLLGAASALRIGTGATPDADERELLDTLSERLTGVLGEDGFRREYDRGAHDPEPVVEAARRL